MNIQNIYHTTIRWSTKVVLELKDLVSQNYLNKIAYIIKAFLENQSERAGHAVAPTLYKFSKTYARVTDFVWWFRVWQPLHYSVCSDTVINQAELVNEIESQIANQINTAISQPPHHHPIVNPIQNSMTNGLVTQAVQSVLSKDYKSKAEFLTAVEIQIRRNHQGIAQIVVNQNQNQLVGHHQNPLIHGFNQAGITQAQATQTIATILAGININPQNVTVQTTSFLDTLSRISYAITASSIVIHQCHEWGIYNLSKISEKIGLTRAFGYVTQKLGVNASFNAPKIVESVLIGSLFGANLFSAFDTLYRFVKINDRDERFRLLWDLYAATGNLILYGACIVGFGHRVINNITMVVRSLDLIAGATKPVSLF